MSLSMLAIACGRSVIAYQADRTGATRMGGRLLLWMWTCAIFILLWFILTIWLLVLLVGESVWTAAVWAVTAAVKVGTASALTSIAAGVNCSTVLTLPGTVSTNTTACSVCCVDLAVFDWILNNSTCFCELDQIMLADGEMKVAMGKMSGSITGAVIMLLAGIWTLMVSASEFGVTRRERQLLRRIAKAQLAGTGGEGAKLLGRSGTSSTGGKLKKNGKPKPGSSSVPASEMVVMVDDETGQVLDVQELPPAFVSSGRGAPSKPASSWSKAGTSFANGLGQSFSRAGAGIESLGGFLKGGRTSKK